MIFWYKVRRWFRHYALTLGLILLVFGAGFSLIFFGGTFFTGFAARDAPPPLLTNQFLEDPYDLSDYTSVTVEAYADGILMKEGCKGLWIAMPYEKTFAIKRAMVGVLDVRPTQHDLMYDIFTNYNINLTYARIERMQHDFYYATLLLEEKNKILQLDSRPSDALALAAKMHAPVYVSTKLLQQQGRDLCNDKQA